MAPARQATAECGSPNPATIFGSQESSAYTAKGIDLAAPLEHGKRNCKPPGHLQDCVCHSSCPRDPSSSRKDSSSLPKVSLGKPYPIAHYVTCDKFSNVHRHYLAATSKVVEPRFFYEAVQEQKWKEAMAKEIEALEDNNAWSVEELPPGKESINCKWVFKVKYKSDGSIERYKARLVIRGDEQIKRFDHTETFAPIAKMTNVRTFLEVVAAKGWELHQTDVNNVFLS